MVHAIPVARAIPTVVRAFPPLTAIPKSPELSIRAEPRPAELLSPNLPIEVYQPSLPKLLVAGILEKKITYKRSLTAKKILR